MTTTQKEIEKNEFEQNDSQTAKQTTNQDMSKSSSDCPLKHVEPAKIALLHNDIEVTDVNFGEHLITTNRQERFRIRNTGDDPITVKVTSSQAPFVIRALEKELKRKGDSESVDVQFQPSADAIQAGELRVSAGDGPDKVINLTGTGTRGKVKLEPDTKDFGGVEVKMSSTPQTFTIINDGTGPLRIDDIVPDKNSKIPRKDSLFSPIEKGKSITFDVVFTPQDADARTASIQIKCKAPAEATTLSVTGQPLNLSRPKIKIIHKGDGVESIEVKLFKGREQPLGGTSWSGIAELKSDAKGFEPGDYEIRLTHPRGLYALAEPVTKKLEPGSGEPIEIEVIKVARPKIEVMWKGNKVPGVTVSLSRGTKEYQFAVFDRNQRYTLKDDAEGLIGGDEPYTVKLDYNEDFKTESKPPTLKIDPGFDGLKTVELVPRPRPSIQLTWKSGGGIKDAVVTLKGEKEYAFGTTNTEGIAKWAGKGEVPAGTYKCSLAFPHDAKFPVVDSGGEVIAEPSISIKEGTLEYFLYAGKPARPKIEVMWKGSKVQGAVVKLSKDPDEYVLDKVDSPGVYELKESAAGLSKGTYQVRVDYQLTDFKPVPEPASVQLDWGATGKHTISLVPLLRPQIKLTWKHGGAVENATVELKGTKNYKFTTPTNDQGISKWSGDGEVDPGTYTCEFTFGDGGKHTVDNAKIEVDKDHLEFTFKVLQASWIKFRVEDIDKAKVTIKWPVDGSSKSFETEKIDVPAELGPRTHCEVESVELPKGSSGEDEAYEFLDITTA